VSHRYKQAAHLTAVDYNIALGTFWQDVRFDYTSGNLDYKGAHYSHDAGTDSPDWEVWKYTWSSGDCVRIEGPLQGAWDNRATLGWGA
jgi:hypothetical protein